MADQQAACSSFVCFILEAIASAIYSKRALMSTFAECPSRNFYSRIFLTPILAAIREIFRSRKFCDIRYVIEGLNVDESEQE